MEQTTPPKSRLDNQALSCISPWFPAGSKTYRGEPSQTILQYSSSQLRDHYNHDHQEKVGCKVYGGCYHAQRVSAHGSGYLY